MFFRMLWRGAAPRPQDGAYIINITFSRIKLSGIAFSFRSVLEYLFASISPPLNNRMGDKEIRLEACVSSWGGGDRHSSSSFVKVQDSYCKRSKWFQGLGMARHGGAAT